MRIDLKPLLIGAELQHQGSGRMTVDTVDDLEMVSALQSVAAGADVVARLTGDPQVRALFVVISRHCHDVAGRVRP